MAGVGLAPSPSPVVAPLPAPSPSSPLPATLTASAPDEPAAPPAPAGRFESAAPAYCPASLACPQVPRLRRGRGGPGRSPGALRRDGFSSFCLGMSTSWKKAGIGSSTWARWRGLKRRHQGRHGAAAHELGEDQQVEEERDDEGEPQRAIAPRRPLRRDPLVDEEGRPRVAAQRPRQLLFGLVGQLGEPLLDSLEVRLGHEVGCTKHVGVRRYKTRANLPPGLRGSEGAVSWPRGIPRLCRLAGADPSSSTLTEQR